MATGMTTTTQVDAAVQTHYDGQLLRWAKAKLLHDGFGQRRSMPQNSGDIVKFRRYTPFTAATAPLVEGVTPTALQLAKTDLTVTLDQYGAYTEITDKVLFTVEDKVLTETAKLLGYHAALTLDTIYRDALIAGAGSYYAGAVANRAAVGAVINTTDLDKIKRQLMNANADFYTNPIKASTGVGTQPIRASWYVIIHPDVAYTVEGLTGFKHVSTYPDPSVAHEAEIGSYGPFRFLVSTNAKVYAGSATVGSGTTTGMKYTGSNCDVYISLIIAPDAYGIVPLSGKSIENIIKPLGAGDDPLNQRATSGWKAFTAAKVLNSTWIIAYETTAAA